MLSAVCVGTNHLGAATTFYDGVLAELDMLRAVKSDVEVGYSIEGQSPISGVLKPYNKKYSNVGNGSQVLFGAKPECRD